MSTKKARKSFNYLRIMSFFQKKRKPGEGINCFFHAAMEKREGGVVKPKNQDKTAFYRVCPA